MRLQRVLARVEITTTDCTLARSGRRSILIPGLQRAGPMVPPAERVTRPPPVRNGEMPATMSTMDDKLMASRAKFEALWDAHYEAVVAYAARRIGVDGAQDVAEETFLTAWRRREHDVANDRAWLLGVARKTIATRQRSAKRLTAVEQELGVLQRSHDDPVDVGVPLVLDALGRLSPKDREALILVYWDGLSQTEGASVAGVPKPLFATRLSRARRRLRRLMGEVDPGFGRVPPGTTPKPHVASGGEDR